jgi:hypothetical protein
MTSDVVGAICTISDYEEARNDLFDEVFTTQGSSAFHTYWNGFRNFLIGQLSKEEFDVIVTNSLSEEKGEIISSIYLMQRSSTTRSIIFSNFSSQFR